VSVVFLIKTSLSTSNQLKLEGPILFINSFEVRSDQWRVLHRDKFNLNSKSIYLTGLSMNYSHSSKISSEIRVGRGESEERPPRNIAENN
jgi:hypothetical protein